MSKVMASEWLKAAEQDLLAITVMLTNENLTPVVAFHAQQCIEKSFKAILELREKKVVKLHSLVRLSELVSEDLMIDDYTVLLQLNELYIESRYPAEIGLLPSGKPTLRESECFHEYAQSIYETISTIIEKES